MNIRLQVRNLINEEIHNIIEELSDDGELYENQSSDFKFRYKMLSRLQSDCDYYLKNGKNMVITKNIFGLAT